MENAFPRSLTGTSLEVIDRRTGATIGPHAANAPPVFLLLEEQNL